MPDDLEKRVGELEKEIAELKTKTLDAKDVMRLMELIAEMRRYIPMPYPVYTEPYRPFIPYTPYWQIYTAGGDATQITTNEYPFRRTFFAQSL